MDKSICNTGITPNKAQVKIGLEYSYKFMQMIAAVKKRNESQPFINTLHSRHKGLIYFMANINRDRHRLKFEQLTEQERMAVIAAMRDLKELSASLPKQLYSSDGVINNEE
jgi:regulatory protein YycI of two-component signal transduction system YycFG